MESVQRLRDEEEEEEEEEGDSGLVARAQNTPVPVGADTALSRLEEVEEEILTQVPEPRATEDVLPRGKETVEEASMIRDAQAMEAYHGEGAHKEEDPFRGYFIGVEDVTDLGDSEAPKKSSGEASALHHEAFLLSRGELSRYEAEVQSLTEQRDVFKLLSERREGEAKGLRAKLEAARKEKPICLRKQLRVEVDVVRAEAEEWKKNMDRLDSEKEAARAQLASTETQLRSLKEKTSMQDKKVEEFQSRLGSVISYRERLTTELVVAKSEVEIATVNVDAMVAVYRSDAEAAQVRAKEVVEAAQARANWVAEHVKCQSLRETLEEIHARGFDLTAKIEKAKELEAKTRVMAFPDDDDDTGSTSGSESEDRDGLL
ncbi:uncharacterized protein [Nicotiana tomentosiformis]|uniref:uncharacterized protein n=1 Tax=Nicotiana tomentosiformis TaxID=4098 RepID=UPI00388C6F9E